MSIRRNWNMREVATSALVLVGLFVTGLAQRAPPSRARSRLQAA